jgi:hypothetical protein
MQVVKRGQRLASSPHLRYRARSRLSRVAGGWERCHYPAILKEPFVSPLIGLASQTSWRPIRCYCLEEGIVLSAGQCLILAYGSENCQQTRTTFRSPCRNHVLSSVAQVCVCQSIALDSGLPLATTWGCHRVGSRSLAVYTSPLVVVEARS